MGDGAVLTVDVRPTPRDYEGFQAELMRDLDAMRFRGWAIWFLFITNTALVAAGVQFCVTGMRMPPWLAVLACLCLASFVTDAIRLALLPLLCRTMLDRKGLFLSGYEARIETDALLLRGSWGETRYRWPAILRSRETIDHILVYVDRTMAILIPKHSFASRRDAESFAGELRVRMRAAAALEK
jgi:hypothetical protein